MALSCPSGAITIERLDGGPTERAPAINVAAVRENGPLALHAELQIDEFAPRFRATFCRCGASERKPFCDGSHVASGFVATGEPPTEASAPLAVRNGLLKIHSLPDGPLVAEGNLEILSGTGRTVMCTQTVAFCRCGASQKKPFCDGSHSRLGFKAEGHASSE
ncbi:MAG: CDGSH iron-sulfur domain-containing protein [Acidiferrobacter sp.]